MKKILAGILLSCMVFSLAACGSGNGDSEKNSQNTENTQESQNDSAADSESESEEGVVYTIKVVDEGGNPVAGVVVQLCKESCMPNRTDENGVAEFPVDAIEEGYKAGVTNVPDGYVYEGEEYVYYEGDATEVTLTLKAAQ